MLKKSIDFDKEDKVGNAYWQKTTGSLHESEGGYLWSVARCFSYIPEEMSIKS